PISGRRRGPPHPPSGGAGPRDRLRGSTGTQVSGRLGRSPEPRVGARPARLERWRSVVVRSFAAGLLALSLLALACQQPVALDRVETSLGPIGYPLASWNPTPAELQQIRLRAREIASHARTGSGP